MNASSFLGPLNFVMPVYGYIMPVLTTITTIANALIIMVLTRPEMASPTNTVLLSLASCDLLTILLPAPWYIYTYTLHKSGQSKYWSNDQSSTCSHHSMNWTESLCFMYEFFVETSPQLFHNASIWLTLILAVQRYIYICQASRARHLCTIPRARKMVGAVIVTACLHMSPRMFDRVYNIEAGQSVSRLEYSFTFGLSLTSYCFVC